MFSAIRDLKGRVDVIYVNMHMNLMFILVWNALLLDKFEMKLSLSWGKKSMDWNHSGYLSEELGFEE